MVSDADRAELERCARAKGASARMVELARTVLLAADGLTGAQIAERAGCTEPTVIKWCRRYTEAGLTGLEDTPRPGGPKTVLTEEVSDKPSDYGSRLLQTQRDVTRHRNPSDLR